MKRPPSGCASECAMSKSISAPPSQGVRKAARIMSPRFDEPRELNRSAVDQKTAHSARIWNYWLGGKDNYAVDCEVGDQVAEMLPSIVEQARQDREFLKRAVRY